MINLLSTQTSTALIDGDIIAYRVAAAVESVGGDEMDVISAVSDLVMEWTSAAYCTEMIVCLGTKSFRHTVAEDYKAHRADKEKPVFLDTAYEALKSQFTVQRMQNLEADDVLGILSTDGSVDNPVIVSIDKDLESIPGWYFNPSKFRFPILIDRATAWRNFCLQWLMGDSSDNYKGIPRVGPKTAAVMLDEAGCCARCLTAAVVKAYRDKGLEWDYCVQQARLARILVAGMYDEKTGTVDLWTPDPVGEYGV